jgi:quercetin dioxygenase-like cupin family protein
LRTPKSSAHESDPDWRSLTSVEGQPLLGGSGRSRLRLRGEEGLLLEVVYPAGVSSPEHTHEHDSYLYLLRGHLAGTLDGNVVELHPGQTLLQPALVSHSVSAVSDSHWLEFKAPPQIVWA